MGGILLQDLEVHGLPGALLTGNMLRSYLSPMLSQSVTKMQLLLLVMALQAERGKTVLELFRCCCRASKEKTAKL